MDPSPSGCSERSIHLQWIKWIEKSAGGPRRRGTRITTGGGATDDWPNHGFVIFLKMQHTLTKH